MAEQEEIQFQPTDELCCNPNLELTWDRTALAKELDRSFELRHSYRT